MLAELLIVAACGQMHPAAGAAEAAVKVEMAAIKAQWIDENGIPRLMRHSLVAHDMLFSRAVEQSIQREPGAHPPEPYRSIIDDFGCDCYVAREMAFERFVRLCWRDRGTTRWAYWGLRHPDIEVRLWCNKVLRTLSECTECHGDGLCRFKRPSGPEQWPGQNSWCVACGCNESGHQRDGENYVSKCRDCDGDGRHWSEGVPD